MSIRSFLGLAFFIAPFLALASSTPSRFFAKYTDDGKGRRQLVSEGFLSAHPAVGEAVEETSSPEAVVEHEGIGASRIIELTSADPARVRRMLRDRGVRPLPADGTWEDTDTLTSLVSNGPAANRIDLVFMGDGYTEFEQEKFLNDVRRLTRDMFEGPTFRSYLPVFNVHAVFRASKESGIGKNDKPKDTAYGLYRVGNTLRAILPSKASAAHASCRKAPGCDYPIIVANDPYYGGLGGQFAITTSSETSGTMVLRHELGHNFGVMGEEYDGANFAGYYGANHSGSLRGIGWKHWVSGELRPEPTIARYVGWPWHSLANGPFGVTFTSDSGWSRSDIQLSISGLDSDDDIRITLDGNALELEAPGHADRAYHRIETDAGFGTGQHRLEFREKISDGNNMVSNLTLHEHGPGYHSEEGYIGAFPLFSSRLEADGFRPTHDTCLMRNMTSRRFCSVCQENNWLQFFAKVSLIDEVKVSRDVERVSVTLQSADLPLKIQWLRDGNEVATLFGRKQWSLPTAEASGRWQVRVHFETPEVRHDPKGLLKGKRDFKI